MSTPAPDALARILADSPVSVADVRKFFGDHPAGPSLLQAITAGLPPVADDVPDDVFAATLVQAFTGTAARLPRRSGATKLRAAKRALAAALRLTISEERLESPLPLGLEDGIPDVATMTNKLLLQVVTPHLPYAMSDPTILRAAGRRR
jgi:hypothetical protein